MLKSISTWIFEPSRSPVEVFALAKEQGFDGVEVAIGDGTGLSHQVTPDSTQEQCTAVVKAAEEAGIQLASMASGFGWKWQIISDDPSIRTEAIEMTKKSLRVASYLGVDAMLLVPGNVCEVTDYETAYNNALDSLKQIAPIAEEVGVTVGIENVWNKWLLSPLEFRNFLDEVNSPRVGCYFDVGNAVLNGYPEQWVRILGSRIIRVHFKDFKRSVGTGKGFCPLLEGDVDYPAVVKALNDVGYDGPVTAEFFGVEEQLPAISSAMNTILGR